MMRLILIISGLFLFFPACVKREPDCCLPPLAELIRTQTQCADVWGYGSKNAATITKLTNYLLQKQITTSKIELQPTGEAMVCTACICSNGYVFHVWAESQYINNLIAEGFTIK
jgi:hypothetical protein